VVFGTYKVGALRHAQVYFAGTPVRDITRSDCRAFRAALQAGGCTGARRPLKRNASVNHAYRAMRAVLEMAVEDNAMPANPAVLRRVPGVRSTKEKKFQAVYLDAGSVEAMAGALADREPYGLMVRFWRTQAYGPASWRASTWATCVCGRPRAPGAGASTGTAPAAR
jgi:hypothetical protein